MIKILKQKTWENFISIISPNVFEPQVKLFESFLVVLWLKQTACIMAQHWMFRQHCKVYGVVFAVKKNWWNSKRNGKKVKLFLKLYSKLSSARYAWCTFSNLTSCKTTMSQKRLRHFNLEGFRRVLNLQFRMTITILMTR